MLKAQITGTSKAITNTQRANSLIAMADSSMNMIGNLLNDIKGLVVESANTGAMTASQIAANQMQVDAALDSIDRIARTTNYGGKKILDGSLGFQTAGVGGGISNLQINSANFGTAEAVGVNVNVTAAADYARLVSNGTGVSVDTVFDVIGNNGSATVSVGAGSTNDDIAAAINRSTDSTGVLAYVEGKESYGSIVLSSTGAGNDILITALSAGLDAGNYEFRITRGAENDARIVTEAAGGKPGVVEISLVSAYESRFNNFAGLFDINIDTTGRDNPETAVTSVTMQQGAANGVVYNASDKAAATNVINGKSLVAQVTDANGDNINSQLNGWTIAIDDRIATAADHSVADTLTKTIYVNSTSFENNDVLNSAIKNALANTVDGTVADFDANAEVKVNIVGNASTFANGDRFTFANGAAQGEVSITYAAGATANDILKMLNSAPNVSASLASGVNGNAAIPNQPNGLTSVHNSGANEESRYSSGATSQEVIDLINSKLGDKFLAVGLASDTGTGGRVGFQDASAIWGDINLGNALRFSGMDNGPIVRLTTLGTNGAPVANQQLGVNIIHPTEADKLAGIHTPILEIKLATDAQGNSITTASDITKLFNSLTKEQTMGVSVSQLYPPGVDPNGRIFGVGDCGEAVVIDTCPTPIDGIVQPTGAPGVCGPQEGDIVLLGGNQMIVADTAFAKIAGHNRPAPVAPPATIWTDPAENPAPDDPPRREYRISGTADNGGTTGALMMSFSEEAAAFLEGIGIGFTVDTGTPTAITATFTNGAGGPIITFNGTAAQFAAATAAGAANGDAFVAAVNNMLSTAGSLDDFNSWLESKGREPLTDPSPVPESLENGDIQFRIVTGSTDNSTTTITAASSIAEVETVEEIHPEGPSFEFSLADAEMLDGVTIVFAESPNVAPADQVPGEWDADTNTLTIYMGGALQNPANAWNATTNPFVPVEELSAEDALDLLNAALSDAAIFAEMQESLGWDEDFTAADNAPEALRVTAETDDGKRIIVVAGSSSIMDATLPQQPTFEAITGAVPGEVTHITDAVPAQTTGGSFEFEYNGVTFVIEAAAIDGVKGFDLLFGAPAATAAANWVNGNLTITLPNAGTTGFVQADYADPDAFIEKLTAMLNATMTAGGAAAWDANGPGATQTGAVWSGGKTLTADQMASFFTVTVKEDPGLESAWNTALWDAALTAATAATAVANAMRGSATTTDARTFETETIPEVPAVDASGKTILSFGETSAMNGMTFTFTREEAREGFNAATGQLTIFLGSEFEALAAGDDADAADAALRAAVNGAIAANWEAIRAFTGNGKTNTSVLELDGPVKLAKEQADTFNVTNAIADAAAADNPFAKAADGKTMITGSYVEGTVTGQRGIAKDDAVMSITAKEAGTHMAGIAIHFVNDVHSGLNQWNNAYETKYAAGDALPDLKVELHTKTDGSRELIIIGNLGADSGSELNAGLLARALNGAMMTDVASGKQVAFSSMFDANALQFAAGENNGDGMAGSVLFNRDVVGAQGTMVGGYRVSSGDGSATSSGIGMLGQSDANERLVIESEELGSSQFVQINMITGYMATVDTWGNASNYGNGQDMIATINGTRATADGNYIGINTADLSVSMSVANGVGNTGFTITGGGALFQLGPDVVSQQQMRVGIASMLTTNLGGKDGALYLLKEGGIAALNSNDAGRRLADRIINQAIENVATQRGRLGALQRGSLEPNIIALQDSLTAMTEANALITNADFAVESSNLTRFQLLVQSGMQTLGIANQMPQYAAQLVR